MQLREIGNRLRILRQGRTQKEFSSFYGIPQGTLSKVESGKLEPSLDFLAQVSKNEGVSIRWILTGEPDDVDGKWVVQESAAEYQTLPLSSRKLIHSVTEILKRGNETVVQALKANIRAYMEAVGAAGKDDKDRKNLRKRKGQRSDRGIS